MCYFSSIPLSIHFDFSRFFYSSTLQNPISLFSGNEEHRSKLKLSCCSTHWHPALSSRTQPSKMDLNLIIIIEWMPTEYILPTHTFIAFKQFNPVELFLCEKKNMPARMVACFCQAFFFSIKFCCKPTCSWVTDVSYFGLSVIRMQCGVTALEWGLCMQISEFIRIARNKMSVIIPSYFLSFFVS